MTADSRRSTLAREVQSIEQVMGMDDSQLRLLQGKHEAEIIDLENRLARSTDERFTVRGGAALKVLKLHLKWINAEIQMRNALAKQRKVIENIEREKRNQAEAQAQKESRAITVQTASALKKSIRLEIIRTSHEQIMSGFAHFKRLVRAHVGETVYMALWMEVERLLQEEELEGKADGEDGESLKSLTTPN